MLPEKTARRSFLSALAATVAASFAGRARADGIDIAEIGRVAAPLKPPEYTVEYSLGRVVADASWEYGVRCVMPDGSEVVFPTDDAETVERSCLRGRDAGCTVHVERRAVGPWERYEPAERVAAELATKVD